MGNHICCNLQGFTVGSTGGAEAFLSGLLPELVGQGLDISVRINSDGVDWARKLLGQSAMIGPEVDVLDALAWYPLNRAPLMARIDVLTVHDSIPLHYLDHAGAYHLRPKERAGWAARWYWTRFSARRARAVVSVSDAAAKDLSLNLKRDVVGIANGHSSFMSDAPSASWSGSKSQTILCVTSGGKPHKGTAVIAEVAARMPEVRFVVLGRGEMPSLPNVERPGWIERSELISLYQSSRALFFPSYIEGFGLPVLEALHVGLPIVCSDIAPLREICGAEHAVFVAPRSVEEAVVALGSLEDLRPSPRAIERASSFTWAAAASKYAQLFREMER